MFDKLNSVEQRFEEVESRLADPSLASNPIEFRRLSLEHSTLQEIVDEFRNYKKMNDEFVSNKELLGEKDEEIAELAKEELKRLEPAIEESKQKLRLLLLPQDPNDAKNVIFEIRAGAGGEEAALFVAALFRMYQRYAERQGWRVEIMSSNPTGLGGLREIIAMISGARVFSRLKWEGGVHRVQRVPETEAQGRIHTSTVTVAVLPEAEEVDVNINPADLRIDVFRSGGAGGQGVNTTDSAVRIVHKPTGLEVRCQDERSQLKNKAKAMKVLRSRLLERKIEEEKAKYDAERSTQVGTGERSEKIRTYNFPQNRVTDHRIELTIYNLAQVIEGTLDDVLEPLLRHDLQQRLAALSRR